MKKHFYLLMIAMLCAFGNVLCAQDFSSTGSDMMSTGSTYSSTVTGVGATGVNDMYSTTETSTTTTRPGARKSVGGYGTEEELGDPEDGSPIGSDVVLFFFAAVAAFFAVAILN